MKNICNLMLIALMSTFSIFMYGQVSTEFGVISQFEKDYDNYNNDENISCVYLLKDQSFETEVFGTSYRIKIINHTKKKILTKASLKEGDYSFSFNSRSEELVNIRAAIYHKDGSRRIVFKNQFKIIEVDKNVKKYIFTFDNVKVGSIVEAEVITHIKPHYYVGIQPFLLQEKLPIVSGHFDLINCKTINYNTVFYPGQLLIKDEDLSKDKDLSVYAYKEMKLTRNEDSFVVENAIPINESLITTKFELAAKVIIQPNYVKDLLGSKQNLFFGWESLSVKVRDEHFAGQQLFYRNYKKAYNDLADRINNKLSNDKKIEIIYNHINKHMEWNGDFSRFASQELNKSYEKAIGNSADINYLFIALCQEFNIPVSQVLISTIGHGKVLPSYSSLYQFNHVLALCTYKNTKTIIDLAGENYPIGEVRPACLNGFGWVVQKGDPIWVKMEGALSENAINSIINITADGEVEGKTQYKMKGITAVLDRTILKEDKGIDFWKERSIDESSLIINSFDIKELDNPNKPLKITTDYLFIGESNSDRILLNPNILQFINLDDFKMKERIYDIKLPFSISYSYSTTIKVDPAYTIESLPEDYKMVLSDNEGEFYYKVVQTGQNIQIKTYFSFLKTEYSFEKYDEIKTMYNTIFDHLNEIIILKKL